MKRSVQFAAKTTRMLMIAAALFCLLVGTLATVFSGLGMYNNYRTFAEQNLGQSVSDMELYVQTSVSAAGLITQNEEVTSALARSEYLSDIENAMTQFQFSTLSVYSAQLYDLNGHCYKTAGTEDVPPLGELLENEFFRAYVQSGRQSAYWLRTSHMPGIYNNNRYDSASGMYTFVTRILYKEETVGYFLLDFSPFRILSSFFDYGSADGYRDCVVYFTADGKALRSDSSGAVNEHLYIPTDEKTDRQGNVLYIVSELPARNCYAVAVLPLTAVRSTILLIACITLASGAVCILMTYLIARTAVQKTLKPLTELTKSIENTISREADPKP